MAILVIYDGSKESEKALAHAVEKRDEDEIIHLITVIPRAHLEEFEEVDLGESVEEARERVQVLRRFYKADGVTIKYTVREGEAVDEILSAARSIDARLIVFGAGVSRIGKFQIGNISQEVTNRAGRPVMVVR